MGCVLRGEENSSNPLPLALSSRTLRVFHPQLLWDSQKPVLVLFGIHAIAQLEAEPHLQKASAFILGREESGVVLKRYRFV
jgi:hypothetical protein